MKQKTVCIVGMGPAGLFASKKLIDNGYKVIAIDKGKKPKERKKEDLLFGVGGAGLFSDGKLNFSPFIGGDLTEFVDLTEAEELIKEIDAVFTENGMTNGYERDYEKLNELTIKSIKAGIRLVQTKQKHIGSDYLPLIVNNMLQKLLKNGLELRQEEAKDIKTKDDKVYSVITNKSEIIADYFLFSIGRFGSIWFNKLSKIHGIETKALGADIGVRVETNSEIAAELTDIVYDPKIHIFTNTFDDFVRTFCTNPKGFVVSESYDGFINVNGHALRDKKSKNSNFALLVRINLTDPIEDSTSYAEKIGQLANFLGGGKPLLQRLGDLKKGRRSTWKRINTNLVEPSLKNITPGDISLLLPHRIIIDLLEGLEKLEKIMPGIYSDSTLLYAPEIKLTALRIKTDRGLKSINYNNLYVAGDGAGVSRDIINAAATGLISAKSIIDLKTSK